MNVLSKEELLKSSFHNLTMKDLRRFVSKNSQIDDNTPVLVQRVEDVYFEGREWNGKKINGWSVYLTEGDRIYWAMRQNENMLEEIENRKNGGEWQYPLIDNPEEHIVDITDDMKEQFYQGFCITKENDNSTVLIYNHY